MGWISVKCLVTGIRKLIFRHAPVTMVLYSLKMGGMRPNEAVSLAFLSMLPDLDHFFPPEMMGTRVFLHNVFLFGILAAIALLISRRFFIQVVVGVGSHLLLDLGDTYGVSLFFPLTRQKVIIGLYSSPESSFRNMRGIPLDLAISFTCISVFLLYARYREKHVLRKAEGD